MSETTPPSEAHAAYIDAENEYMGHIAMYSIAEQLDIPESLLLELGKACYVRQQKFQDAWKSFSHDDRPSNPGLLQKVADALVRASSMRGVSAKADIHLYVISSVRRVEDGTLEAKCTSPLVTEGNPVFAVSGDRVDSPGRPTKFIVEA